MVAVLIVRSIRGKHTYNTTGVGSLRSIRVQYQYDSYNSLLCQVSLTFHRAPIVIEGDLRGMYENGVPQARVKVLYSMNLINIPKIVA